MDQRTDMNSLYLYIFQSEVYHQCTFALMRFDDFNAACKNQNMEKFWYGIQSFLNSTTNVSKLLWDGKPVCKKKNESDKDFEIQEKQRNAILERRKALRESLEVSDNSLLKERTMRNNFEHLDERIDTWFNLSRKHNLANRNIISEGAISGLDECDFLCTFNTSKNTITFKGEDYKITPIVMELQTLKKLAKQKIESFF